MGAILSWLLGKLSQFLTPVIAVTIGILLVATLTLGYLYKSKVEEHISQTQYVERLIEEVGALNVKIIDEQKENKQVSIDKEKFRVDFFSAKSQLNKLKGRSQEVASDTLVEQQKLQQSFDSFMIDIGCITGDTSKCVKP